MNSLIECHTGAPRRRSVRAVTHGVPHFAKVKHLLSGLRNFAMLSGAPKVDNATKKQSTRTIHIGLGLRPAAREAIVCG